jgi:Flp pilus assembly protein TadG
MLRSLRSDVRRFARNRRGSVAILFGLAIIPIALGVGVAVDYGRALLVRERMASAADAAALAIGSWTGLTQAELKAKAQQYFDANYPANSLGAAGKLNVSFKGDDIYVSVSGKVPTTFMRLANVNSVDVGVSAVITKKQRNIELALVLDTTGSMRYGGKMQALQSAAKMMVKDLFDGNARSDTA